MFSPLLVPLVNYPPTHCSCQVDCMVSWLTDHLASRANLCITAILCITVRVSSLRNSIVVVVVVVVVFLGGGSFLLDISSLPCNTEVPLAFQQLYIYIHHSILIHTFSFTLQNTCGWVGLEVKINDTSYKYCLCNNTVCLNKLKWYMHESVQGEIGYFVESFPSTPQ